MEMLCSLLYRLMLPICKLVWKQVTTKEKSKTHAAAWVFCYYAKAFAIAIVTWAHRWASKASKVG